MVSCSRERNTEILRCAQDEGVEKGFALNALFAGLPDIFVDLQAEAGGKTVGEHPFDDEARIEHGVVGGALIAGQLVECRREKNAATARGERVGMNEVASEFVVGAIGEDKLHFVTRG